MNKIIKNKIKLSGKAAFVIVVIAVAIGVYFVASLFSTAGTIQKFVNTCGNGTCDPNQTDKTCSIDCLEQRVAFIAVHMEAGDRALRYAADQWPVLIQLIELADQYNYKLTLQFNPQWAEYILKDKNKLVILRGWEENGHEIAFHHHGPFHGNWNGYTNLEFKKQDPRYLGPMTEAADLINQLPVSGQVLTAGGGSEDSDWLQGVIYDTNGGRSTDDLLSTPVQKVWNEQPVTQIKYRMYGTTDPSDAALTEIEAAYENMDGKIMGIVFHVHDFEQRKQKIVNLFESFKSNNISVQTVKKILE